mmetsp:Transcript_59689/g.189917  ORF Transcript_59689/g.189917 Transcript_59689/m.189917 type:complete len:478 (+) Transcript_59689:123-1556(+)
MIPADSTGRNAPTNHCPLLRPGEMQRFPEGIIRRVYAPNILFDLYARVVLGTGVNGEELPPSGRLFLARPRILERIGVHSGAEVHVGERRYTLPELAHASQDLLAQARVGYRKPLLPQASAEPGVSTTPSQRGACKPLWQVKPPHKPLAENRPRATVHPALIGARDFGWRRLPPGAPRESPALAEQIGAARRTREQDLIGHPCHWPLSNAAPGGCIVGKEAHGRSRRPVQAADKIDVLARPPVVRDEIGHVVVETFEKLKDILCEPEGVIIPLENPFVLPPEGVVCVANRVRPPPVPREIALGGELILLHHPLDGGGVAGAICVIGDHHCFDATVQEHILRDVLEPVTVQGMPLSHEQVLWLVPSRGRPQPALAFGAMLSVLGDGGTIVGGFPRLALTILLLLLRLTWLVLKISLRLALPLALCAIIRSPFAPFVFGMVLGNVVAYAFELRRERATLEALHCQRAQAHGSQVDGPCE